jgi:predicted ATPase
MASGQPSGRVTLLFTDIEGSTRLLDEMGPEAYREALGAHRRALREVFTRHGGYEVDYEGDAFFVAFQEASAGVAAAREAQEALAGGSVRVRMGLHTGAPLLDPPKYVGMDVHVAARVMSAGHGGQVLLTRTTCDDMDEPVRELGEHRLKDVDEPVALFQLGDGSFPPLKTISNTNLPRPASSFVGREREVAEVVALLRESRLVTLTGPGGSGKTRLAIEAAAELVPEAKAGVFWVGLASLRDASLVLDTIAQTVGAKSEPATHIGEREMVLLIDNFEQVVDASADISRLLEACPNLRVLVTSRELLRIRGEVDVPVLPLEEAEAVELFADRAGVEHDDDFVELCSRLDNLPLAIELAAAAASAFTPREILERLTGRLDVLRAGRDVDPRQATLRATIAWSYELLTPAEQALHARLSVFAGGATLEAAEQVADADLAVLRALVEKSLLRRSDGRFWMLETIREFAAERRSELPDPELLEDRHWAFFLRLAREAEAGERGSLQAEWWNRLDAELDNLRLALDRRRARGEHLEELELATLLKRFWHVRGRLREGKQRIEAALAAAPEVTGVRRARALETLAYMTLFLGGEAVTGTELTAEALHIYEELGDAAGIARMTLGLGVAADLRADREPARAFYERARGLARAAGDLRYASFADHNLANLALQQGDYRLATELAERSLAAARDAGDPGNLHSASLLLAYVFAGSGRIGEARKLGLEVLRETAAAGVRPVARDAVELLAITEVAAGDPEHGVLLAGLAERLREETAEPRQVSGESLYRPAVERAEGLLGPERFRELLARGGGLELEDAVGLLASRRD